MFTVNELFAGLVSVPLNVAEPVVEIVPACATVTETVTVIACPLPRLGAVQVTVPELPSAGPVQVPTLENTPTNCNPGGSTLVNTTLLAVWFCAFRICQL